MVKLFLKFSIQHITKINSLNLLSQNHLNFQPNLLFLKVGGSIAVWNISNLPLKKFPLILPLQSLYIYIYIYIYMKQIITRNNLFKESLGVILIVHLGTIYLVLLLKYTYILKK